jgi:hypothetical protein
MDNHVQNMANKTENIKKQTSIYLMKAFEENRDLIISKERKPQLVKVITPFGFCDLIILFYFSGGWGGGLGGGLNG